MDLLGIATLSTAVIAFTIFAISMVQERRAQLKFVRVKSKNN